ncbi:MAG: hypothetical protein ACYDEP_09725 [Acidimicrobiales bacterium]
MISDALRSYPPAIADTYGHKPFNIKRSDRWNWPSSEVAGSDPNLLIGLVPCR